VYEIATYTAVGKENNIRLYTRPRTLPPLFEQRPSRASTAEAYNLMRKQNLHFSGKRGIDAKAFLLRIKKVPSYRSPILMFSNTYPYFFRIRLCTGYNLRVRIGEIGPTLRQRGERDLGIRTISTHYATKYFGKRKGSTNQRLII